MGRSALSLMASLSCVCVLGAGCGSMQSPASEASSGYLELLPTGCYRNVVVIAEFNPDEPGKTQLNYYAPGGGRVDASIDGRYRRDDMPRARGRPPRPSSPRPCGCR
jgi:hypothetical protein